MVIQVTPDIQTTVTAVFEAMQVKLDENNKYICRMLNKYKSISNISIQMNNQNKTNLFMKKIKENYNAVQEQGKFNKEAQKRKKKLLKIQKL